MTAFIAAVVLMFSFNGCATKVKQHVIVKTKRVVITPPDEMIKTIAIPKPPKREMYIKSDVKDRERILAKYSIELIGNSKKLNNRMKNLQKWKKEIR